MEMMSTLIQAKLGMLFWMENFESRSGLNSQKMQEGFWGFSASFYLVNFHKGLEHWVVTCAFCCLSLFMERSVF